MNLPWLLPALHYQCYGVPSWQTGNWITYCCNGVLTLNKTANPLLYKPAPMALPGITWLRFRQQVTAVLYGITVTSTLHLQRDIIIIASPKQISMVNTITVRSEIYFFKCHNSV